MFAKKELITYMAPHKMPFPPRYRTKLHIGTTGGIAAGTSSGSYQVMLNNLTNPFNSHARNPVWTNLPGSLETLTTLNCVGYSNLCSVTGLYNRYRVFVSSINFHFVPENNADNIFCCVVPQSSLSANTALPTSASEAMSLPFAKDKLYCANQMGTSIRSTIAVHTLEGLTKQALRDDVTETYCGLEGSVTGPGSCCVWNIMWQTPTAVALTAEMLYRVEMTYYVEFWQGADAQLLQS